MRKIMKYISFLCLLCAFAVSSPLLFADTMKPDILDVQTTFKIAGVDKTNIVTSTGTNTAIISGTTELTGSSTVATGLTTATRVIAFLDSASLSGARAYVVGTTSAGNAILKVYGTDTTTLAGSAATVHWLAVGTP